MCSYCGKRKEAKDFALIEGTGKFKNDVPVSICPSCYDEVVKNIKSLPWNPTFKTTWPYK